MQGSADDAHPEGALGGADAAVRQKSAEKSEVIFELFLSQERSPCAK